MSKFYGQVMGAAKTEATRRGHHYIKTSAQSFNGSVITELTYEDDKLMVRINTGTGSTSLGSTTFYGTFDEFVNKLKA
jgi:hypothetical protein